MLSAPRFVCLATLALVAPFGCSSVKTDLPIGNLCAQIPSAEYEFKVLSDAATDNNFYSFEPEAGAVVLPASGSLIVDDDDLTDDYPNYLKGLEVYDAYVKAHPEVVPAIEKYEALTDEAWEKMDEETRASYITPLNGVIEAVLPVCWNYGLGQVFGTSRNDRPSRKVRPMFLSCKDKYDESGDGVIAWWDYSKSTNPSDRNLAACGTLTGAPNTHGMNVWAPVSTYPQGVAGPDVPYDGFTYSGITIPLRTGTYGKSFDLSAYEGVAFWARQAKAEEGAKLDDPNVIAKPATRKNVSKDARAQDGVSQLGVILQTVDTSAFREDPASRGKFSANTICSYGSLTEPVNCSCFLGNTDEGAPEPCAGAGTYADFPGPEFNDGTTPKPYKWGLTKEENGAVVDIPQPFCFDYSPIDSVPGGEAPFRQQCWDGFRTMLEIGEEWKFYMVPFADMRQAGWGAYAKTFRIDQLRSINFLASAFQATNIVFDEVALYKKR